MPSSTPTIDKFRASLISKVAPGENNKLVQLLESGLDIDQFQLKQFVWMHSVSDTHRTDVWKLLLGVQSGYGELRETVQKHRWEEAEVLWRSLQTMRLIETKDGTPGPSDLVRMILLSSGELSDNVNFRSVEVSPLVTIVHHMRIVAGFENWKDSFAMARAARKLFADLFPIHVIEHIANEANRQVDTNLFGFKLDREQLIVFCLSGGASIFKSNRALQKLWDKLLSGGESPPFLMSQIVVFYMQLCSIKSVQMHSQRPLEAGRLSEEDEVRLVQQATEAVLRKPRIKGPDLSSPAATHAAALMPLLRGETGGGPRKTSTPKSDRSESTATQSTSILPGLPPPPHGAAIRKTSEDVVGMRRRELLQGGGDSSKRGAESSTRNNGAGSTSTHPASQHKRGSVDQKARPLIT